jgi:hypothetical protein
MNAEVQKMLDRQAILDVHGRYLQGIDKGDFAQVRACFADDVKAQHHSGPLITDAETLMAALRKGSLIGDMRVMTHFMGNIVFEQLEADTALTEIYVISFHIHNKQPENEIDMRSLRYIDRFKRIGGKWVIAERRHTLDWQCRQTAGFAATFASRVTKL